MNTLSDSEPRGVTRIVRTVAIGAALAVWFVTQALLARRVPPATGVGDALLAWTSGANAYLHSNPACANALLIASSLLIDVLALFLLLRAIFGPTIRPFLGLLLVFALRQICQSLVSLHAPEGMIWHNPGFPSLLVTYGTSSDFFFSGHSAIAVLGALELARLRRAWLTACGVGVALFEISAVILLRAHYTMDVFTGIVTALWVAGIATQLAAAADRALQRLIQR
jgi:hypothetical protein